MTEKAANLWGKAGQRSLERSALVEAVEQFTRALELIATLPATPALRREQIRLQVALITPIIHIKGFSAPETLAATERARLLIEQAEALGEPHEDPLSLLLVLYGSWASNLAAFKADVLREIAAQFLALAQKQGATVPISLYDPAHHRPLSMRFGPDIGPITLAQRSASLWTLGYPKAALADLEQAFNYARQSGHAVTLVNVLISASTVNILIGEYATANSLVDEILTFASAQGALFWKGMGLCNRGAILAVTGNTLDAVSTITSGLAALRSTGSTWGTLWQCYLTGAYAELGQFDDAWHSVREAVTDETNIWFVIGGGWLIGLGGDRLWSDFLGPYLGYEQG